MPGTANGRVCDTCRAGADKGSASATAAPDAKRAYGRQETPADARARREDLERLAQAQPGEARLEPRAARSTAELRGINLSSQPGTSDPARHNAVAREPRRAPTCGAPTCGRPACGARSSITQISPAPSCDMPRWPRRAWRPRRSDGLRDLRHRRWNLQGTPTEQSNLIIRATPASRPSAWTISKSRSSSTCCSTTRRSSGSSTRSGRRRCSILGRFSAERKAVLDAVKDELRRSAICPCCSTSRSRRDAT